MTFLGLNLPLGLKLKNMTFRFEFTIGLPDTNQTTIIGTTIPAVRSSILALRWSETSIWRHRFSHRFQQYGGQRHQFGGGHQSHYYKSQPTGDGGTMAVRWVARPILWRSSEPLFWRFGHQTSTTSGSIGRATGVGSLLKI